MNNVAYIYSHDGDQHGLRFGVELCSNDTLRETIQKHLHPEGVSADEAASFDGVMEEICRKGGVDFEDGWIAVKDGTAAIVEFLIEQLREAKSEERYADEQRFKELQRRQTAETKYGALCEALIGAIDTKAPAIREIAANGGIA